MGFYCHCEGKPSFPTIANLNQQIVESPNHACGCGKHFETSEEKLQCACRGLVFMKTGLDEAALNQTEPADTVSRETSHAVADGAMAYDSPGDRSVVVDESLRGQAHEIPTQSEDPPMKAAGLDEKHEIELPSALEDNLSASSGSPDTLSGRMPNNPDDHVLKFPVSAPVQVTKRESCRFCGRASI